MSSVPYTFMPRVSGLYASPGDGLGEREAQRAQGLLLARDHQESWPPAFQRPVSSRGMYSPDAT